MHACKSFVNNIALTWKEGGEMTGEGAANCLEKRTGRWVTLAEYKFPSGENIQNIQFPFYVTF